MNKLLISFIIAYVVLTAVIIAVKPELHKPVTLAPLNTVVENIPEKTVEQETQIVHVQQYEETETLQIKPQKTEISEQQVKTKEIKPQYTQKDKPAAPATQTQTKPIKTQETKPQTQNSQKQKYELPKSIQDIVNNKPQQVKEPNKIVKQAPPPVQQQKVDIKPKPQPVQQKPVQVQNNAPLTEAEEIIVWNKWRSDLQNKVMRDSRITAPRGTIFRFSFTVNKFGQISNLKVWSDTPNYTNYAIQALKPLLLSYQGQPILNFPARTKRITTNVTGGFVVSTQDKYTTPGDYSDIERVKN